MRQTQILLNTIDEVKDIKDHLFAVRKNMSAVKNKAGLLKSNIKSLKKEINLTIEKKADLANNGEKIQATLKQIKDSRQNRMAIVRGVWVV